MFDDRDADELARVHKAGSEILQVCADLGGTISGEHGIGTEKLREMSFVFREGDIRMMRGVKQGMDPKALCNPGKVIPKEEARA
jgi:FAD/FMN-containing dehydrogenase